MDDHNSLFCVLKAVVGVGITAGFGLGTAFGFVERGSDLGGAGIPELAPPAPDDFDLDTVLRVALYLNTLAVPVAVNLGYAVAGGAGILELVPPTPPAFIIDSTDDFDLDTVLRVALYSAFAVAVS